MSWIVFFAGFTTGFLATAYVNGREIVEVQITFRCKNKFCGDKTQFRNLCSHFKAKPVVIMEEDGSFIYQAHFPCTKTNVRPMTRAIIQRFVHAGWETAGEEFVFKQVLPIQY